MKRILEKVPKFNLEDFFYFEFEFFEEMSDIL